MSMKGKLSSFLLYWNTIRFLKFRQLFWQLYRVLSRLRSPKRVVIKRVPIKSGIHFCEYIPIGQRYLAPDKFEFLNEEHRCRSWNDSSYSKLWLYNLHYFEDLRSKAENARLRDQLVLIQRWINENPQGYGNGWESYPTSLRVVNWIIWDIEYRLFRHDELKSLSIQTEYLFHHMEFHLLGNHLLKNAKALVFSGLYFDGELADKWLQKGLCIWNKELGEQILSDGGHFERSSMYHAIVLEDVLELISISDGNKRVPLAYQKQWREIAKKMFEALEVMVHPDGQISFFNDSAMAIAPEFKRLLEMGHKLGIPFFPKDAVINDLPKTGYAKLTRGDWTLIADAAPIGPDFLPGHAHADSLSFELSLSGKRLLVNSGTSCYGISDERQRQRKSSAHNTLTINNEDSSEVWSGFRVARRANIIQRGCFLDEKGICFYGSHDGYCRLKNVGTHRRSWCINDDGVRIKDHVEGSKKNWIQLFFRFSPEIELFESSDYTYSVKFRSWKRSIELIVSRKMRWRIEKTTYHPQFGITVPSLLVRGECFSFLPFEIETHLKQKG